MAPDDLTGVAAWLKCSPEDLSLRTEEISIDAFTQHIASCRASYPNFPKEEKRMRKILRQLQKGEPAFPVFVEDGDPHRFILEGRHRIVAFKEYGLTTVPVTFAAKRNRAS